MKIFFLSLCFFVGNLFLSETKAQEFINYQVKVVSDSLPVVKGTLEKISPEGVAVNDGYGN